MSVATLLASHSSGDNWALHFASLKDHGLVTSFSDGTIKLYPLVSRPGRDFAPVRTIKAHSTSINAMRSVDGANIIATAAADGIKVFDLRNAHDNPVMTFHNDRNLPFLSLDAKCDLLAGGTELKGADAELHIWDLKTGNIVRSFVDSHHDDITEIKFHPTDDTFLLSGSTDGYVNIYDLAIPEEDDALHQVINFASIHSAGWLSAKRIYTLSHMETFAIHELEDRTEEPSEPKPLDFGNTREAWNCEYIVDLYPGFMAIGANSRNFAALHPFRNEQIDLENSVKLNSAHGEEVVRAVYCPPASDLIYTGGEDGCVKVWKTDVPLNAPQSFFDVAGFVEAVEPEGEKMEVDESDTGGSSEEDEKARKKREKKEKRKLEKKERKEKEKREKRENKEEKEKSGKKDKKDKKDKEKKKEKKKEHRYKPY